MLKKSYLIIDDLQGDSKLRVWLDSDGDLRLKQDSDNVYLSGIYIEELLETLSALIEERDSE